MSNKEVIAFGGLEIRFCLDEEDTNNLLTVFEVSVNPGARVPAPHYHKDFDETLYGLTGTVAFTLDGRHLDIAPGECCFIPRGLVHGFENKTTEQIKFLSIINPGIVGPAYFRELAAIVNAGGPPDMVQLKAVMHKYGLVPAMS